MIGILYLLNDFGKSYRKYCIFSCLKHLVRRFIPTLKLSIPTSSHENSQSGKLTKWEVDEVGIDEVGRVVADTQIAGAVAKGASALNTVSCFGTQNTAPKN